MKYCLLVVAIAMMAVPALSGDFDGKWVGTVDGQDGKPVELTYNFKSDGDTLTGTLKSRFAEREILEGKIKGDTISFTIQTEQFAIFNTGTLSGDEIKLAEKIGQDTLNVILKRVR